MKLTAPIEGRRTFAVASLAGAATAFAFFLLSLRDYGAGNGGEALARIVRESYLLDLVRANAKLALMLAAAGAVHGAIAGVVLVALEVLRGRPTKLWRAAFAGGTAFVIETVLAFGSALVESPGSVTALWPYDAARLDPLYDHLRPWMVEWLDLGLFGLAGLVVLAAIVKSVVLKTRSMAGERRRIDFRFVRPVPVGASIVLAIAAGSIAATTSTSPAPRTDERPNVLVLLSDSMRADRIGAERKGEKVSPNIDALAAKGRKFANCFVPVARTTESVVSMMTSSWPQHHGVRTSWVTPAQTRLPIQALPEVFRDAGYETYGTGEWNSSDFGRFQLGFEHAVVPEETWNVKTIVSRGGRATAFLVRLHYANALGEWLAPEIYYYPGSYGAPGVTRRLGAKLAQVARSPRPAFIMAFYGCTHAPFTASGEHLHHFCDPAYHGPNRYCLMAKTISDAVAMQGERMRQRDLEQVEAVYDAAVRTFDDEVGAVVAKLDALGLSKNTIVVVGSDHGTAFYERGSFGQGNEIASDVSNRIPLVVYDPRLESKPRGAATHIVRSIDLAPTLCSLAGIKTPAAWQGSSLVPLLEDPTCDLGLRAYAETGLWIAKQEWQSEELDFGFPSIYEMLEVPDRASGLIATKDKYVRLMIRAQHRMIRDDRWKLLYVPTRHAPRIKLFDMTAKEDPPRDVAAEHADVVADLKATLDAILAREPSCVFDEPLPVARSAPDQGDRREHRGDQGDRREHRGDQGDRREHRGDQKVSR